MLMKLKGRQDMTTQGKSTPQPYDWTYSVFSWFGYFMPFEERIRAIKQAGFDAVMLSWEDEMAPYAYPKEAFPDAVRSLGLNITNFHAPYIGYNQIWEKTIAENADYVAAFVDMIADCARFDVPAIVVHTNDLDLDNDGMRLDNGYAFFSELAEAGERYGVDIAVENVSRTFLLRYVLDRIDTPRFGMCYDVSHDYMLHCGRGKLLREYGDRLKALHLSDNDLNLDRHMIPGEGLVPEAEVVRALQALDWHILSFEVIASGKWREKEPIDFLKALRGSMAPILAEAEK